jgi:hypothetical protein
VRIRPRNDKFRAPPQLTPVVEANIGMRTGSEALAEVGVEQP